MELYKNKDWKEVTINNEKRNIPKELDVIKLKNTVLINGKNIKKAVKYINYIDIASINENKINNIQYLKENFPSRAKRVIKHKDTIVSTVRPNLKCFAYVDDKFEGHVCSTGFVTLTPEKIIDKFLYFLFKLENTTNYLITNSNGGTYPTFNTKVIEGFEYCNFSMVEQDNIAEILSSQEKVIEKTKELIKNLEKRNQFMIEELLSGRLRIKEDTNGQVIFYKNEEWKTETINGEEVEIPKDWLSSKIHNEIDFFTTGSAFKANEMITIGKYPVVKMTDIKQGKIENGFKVFTNTLKSNALLQKGDLIIGLSGSVGKIGEVVTEQQLLLNQRCLGLRLQKNKNFVKSILMSNFKNWIFKTVKEGVIPNLSHLDVLNYEILSMKDLEKNLINKTISDIIDEKEKYEKILKEEEKKFDFLLEELMSGRLRIKK